jgi:hypothetical protein
MLPMPYIRIIRYDDGMARGGMSLGKGDGVIIRSVIMS